MSISCYIVHIYHFYQRAFVIEFSIPFISHHEIQSDPSKERCLCSQDAWSPDSYSPPCPHSVKESCHPNIYIDWPGPAASRLAPICPRSQRHHQSQWVMYLHKEDDKRSSTHTLGAHKPPNQPAFDPFLCGVASSSPPPPLRLARVCSAGVLVVGVYTLWPAISFIDAS
jgi:hypothetical protein